MPQLKVAPYSAFKQFPAKCLFYIGRGTKCDCRIEEKCWLFSPQEYNKVKRKAQSKQIHYINVTSHKVHLHENTSSPTTTLTHSLPQKLEAVRPPQTLWHASSIESGRWAFCWREIWTLVQCDGVVWRGVEVCVVGEKAKVD